jgi:kinesin family member 11
MASRRQVNQSAGKGVKGAPASSRPVSNLSRVPLSEAKERKALSSSSTEEGTSIQVAIRCRRRSEKEVDEKSPVVASFSRDSSQSVTVELASVTSTFGVVSLPPTRTYPFDTVFGPDADQATVYNEVVSPMLEEVLRGYNCTLFAYGQTGTGKTLVLFLFQYFYFPTVRQIHHARRFEPFSFG